MALSFTTSKTVTELGKEVTKYVIGGLTGTGVTLAMLLAWTGAKDLETIKESVNQFEQVAEVQVSNLVGTYEVTVDEANKEIGAYKEALKQANSNISQLITAYNKAEQEHQKELEALENSMLTEAEANEIIAKANEEINAANEAVASTKDEVQVLIKGSNITNLSVEERIAETEKELDITGDKSVTDIPSNIPTQKPTEQPQE